MITYSVAVASTDRSSRLLDDLAGGVRTVHAWLGNLADASDLAEVPTVLHGWSVAVLVAHLGTMVEGTVTTLGRPTRERPMPLSAYLRAYAPHADEIDARERARAAGKELPTLLAELASAGEALATMINSKLPPTVLAPRGPLRLPDFLNTRVVELVVHADDLHRSLGGDPVRLGRRLEGGACRTLAAALAEENPGQTLEVRVPPHAAVQCGFAGDGPTHTRGTPPNVVETDPATFLRLATGRLTWAGARTDGTVRASGVRADLTSMLPVL